MASSMLSIPNYTLTAKIYEGGTSLIYRGYRTADHLPVVVKIPRSEFPTGREVSRLRHEYGLLHDLDVPGVPRAYALERFGRGLALVLSDVGGQPLDQRLRNRPLSLVESLEIAQKTAAILDALHARRILHKNIQPQNILFDERTGTVGLVDFGRAAPMTRELRSPPGAERPEGVAYMSPEATGRLPRALDPRSDLYSLGVTLFEMLTGTLPFGGSEPSEIIYSHIARTPPSPRSLRPDLPPVVAALVLRLLAKAAEDRYQTAAGLRHDLERCVAALRDGGNVADFPLGGLDQQHELRLPQRLLGRDHELAVLQSMLERVRGGAVEVALISGPSGVGKSVLAAELHLPIASRGGFFLQVRFEEQSHGQPFEAVLHAGRLLVRRLLTLPARVLEGWKQRLHDALGGLGQLMVAVIPELQQIIGPQPTVPELEPQEAQNRFVLLCQSFLRALAGGGHPLILFLDGLQWADAASLDLLYKLLVDPHAHHLLAIATYSGDVSETQLLSDLVAKLQREHIPVGEIVLGNLQLDELLQLLSAALHTDTSRLLDLGEEVLRKTRGNPYFVCQFLRAMADEGALAYSRERREWSWDLERIRQAPATDNVAALMVGRLKRLGERAVKILGAAACIGQQFELQALAAATAAEPGECEAAIAGALHEELVQQLGGDYQLLAAPDAPAPSSMSASGEPVVSYRFVHERVRSALHAAVEPADRLAIHLRIGRYLEATRGTTGRALFDVVAHLNQARQLLHGREERVALAQLNLHAGQRTMATSSILAAADYFAIGVELLGDEGWAEHHELCFTLHLTRARCDALSGRHAEAEARLRELSQRALSRRERALIHLRGAELLFTRGEYVRSLTVGLTGLSLFDIQFPDPGDDRETAMKEELAAVATSLGKRQIPDLVNAPALVDKELQVAAELLGGMNATVYIADPGLFPFIVLRQVRFALQHGPWEGTDYLYACYAFFLATTLGQKQAAEEYAKLALALNRRFGSPRTVCRVNVSLALLWHRLHPLRDTMPLVDVGLRSGLEVGDYTFLSIGWQAACLTRFDLSDDLTALLGENEQALTAMKLTRDALSSSILTLSRQATLALLGRTTRPGGLDDGTFVESTVAAQLRARRVGPPMVVYLGKRLLLDYLFDAKEDTWALALEAATWESGTVGLKWTEDLIFIACLTLIARMSSAPLMERVTAARRIGRHYQHYVELSKSCPQNYAYRERLLAAERARADGKTAEAVILYDEAVAAVKATDFPIYEALTCERAAMFHDTAGRRHLAAFYMADAYYSYARIGARTKADRLAARYPHLIHAELGAVAGAGDVVAPVDAAGSPTRRASESFDLRAALQAAHAIATEPDLGRVIEQLLRTAGSSAGAQRCLLLLEEEDGLVVAARFDSESDRVQAGLASPVEKSGLVASSIVLYAVRTHETITTADAAADPRFASDAYVARGRVRSVLCLPLERRGRILGLLYLENNLTRGAFSQSDADLLRVLGTQAALSIENRRLEQRCADALEQARRAREHLEAEVAQRTSELRKRNAELVAEQQRLRQPFEEPSPAVIPPSGSARS